MLILTIDTSLKNCTVVLAKDGVVLGAVANSDDITHSSRVLIAVAKVLADAGVSANHLNGLGVTVGPGSFTGLRIGMSTVKGLAFGLNLPVAEICTLRALSYQANNANAVAVIDGSKQEVFLLLNGQYHNLGYAQAADLMPADAVITGNGVPLVASFMTQPYTKAAENLWQIKATTLATMAQEAFKLGLAKNADLVMPNYIRKSDAEVQAKKVSKLCPSFS